MYPASPRTERISLKDDVIPLHKPVTTTDGRQIDFLHVKAGTVCVFFCFPQPLLHVELFSDY